MTAADREALRGEVLRTARGYPVDVEAAVDRLGRLQQTHDYETDMANVLKAIFPPNVVEAARRAGVTETKVEGLLC